MSYEGDSHLWSGRRSGFVGIIPQWRFSCVSLYSREVRRFVSFCSRRVRRMGFLDALNCCHVSIHDPRYTMTESDLKTFIDRFATLAPSSRASEKRRLLETNGDAILALHRRGHSWSSIARELSAATEERVSADLLRAACAKRAPQHRARSAKDASATRALRPAAAAAPMTAPTPESGERFGAKGLTL